MYTIIVIAFLLEGMERVTFTFDWPIAMSHNKLREFTKGFQNALGDDYQVIWSEQQLNHKCVDTCLL